MNNYRYKLTVFTPTYNRGYIIGKLYESLKSQTKKDFEWIVIDDGSTDNTELLFQNWIKEENEFKITYLKKKNGGKHRAINDALEIAKGELFFIVDSDDFLIYEAVEKIIAWEKDINNKNNYAGIAGNKGKNKETIIGETFLGNWIDATSLERNKYNIRGDKAEVFYTDVLRKFKFPVFEGENFITENVVWNRIAYEGYKIRWFNEIIYICDYLGDGLTQAGMNNFIKNPKGYALWLHQENLFYNRNLKQRIYSWLSYYIDLEKYYSTAEIASFLKIKKINLYVIVLLWKMKRMIFRNEN